MVCIPFHTFVNTIRYKSNHPNNIIPEYAECQCRIYIIRFILSVFRINYSELYIPYNSNHSGLYCRYIKPYCNYDYFQIYRIISNYPY